MVREDRGIYGFLCISGVLITYNICPPGIVYLYYVCLYCQVVLSLSMRNEMFDHEHKNSIDLWLKRYFFL